MIRKPLLLALSALAVTGLVAAEGVTAGAAPRASATALGRWGGQQAVERLGSRLPSVAAANHLRTAELRNNLLTDPTLYVDGSDTLLYVEPALVGPTVAADNAGNNELAPASADDTIVYDTAKPASAGSITATATTAAARNSASAARTAWTVATWPNCASSGATASSANGMSSTQATAAGVPSMGFPIASTAPISSAATVVSAPFWVPTTTSRRPSIRQPDN